MRTFAEYQIIGRVGRVEEGNGVLRVSIAAEYGRKDNNGEFKPNTFWNEVCIFNENVINWAKNNVQPGDLVRSTGTIRATQYEGKDGETRYGVTLASDTFDNHTLAIRKQIERQQAD